MTNRITTGGCLCGKVRYAAQGEPVNVRVCHCRLCQKAIGAAFNARALFRAEAVTWTGDAARYNSSGDLQRLFCPQCGTTVSSYRPSLNIFGLTLGSVDDPEAFRPDCHFWTSGKISWVETDDLPGYSHSVPL